ncbi:TauD/TfdA family dioxygenase [Reyranella sp.]|uniref:TauD/TfdA family dioxygenase n=1 Tax=Reyranella sp. TaxID=1929291 RepID=UPI003782D68A
MEIRRTPIEHPSAWRGIDVADDPAWRVELGPTEIAEIEQALTGVQRRGLRAGGFTADDFPLPTVEAILRRCRDDVLSGRGFVLLRGLPVEGRDLEAIRTLYWGIGLRLGTPVTQNLAGDLMAEISDRGLDVNALNVKPSQTNAEQRPHSDPADMVALLCVRRPESGGLSRIASSLAIYNEILVHRPDYLDVLYRGFHHDLRGDASKDSPHGVTPQPIPIYRCRDGVVSSVFNASTIKDAQRRMPTGVPAHEMAAVDHIVALAHRDDLRLEMDFRPGDLQILNNYTVLHWRTAFVDGADAAHKRLLYRFWVNVPGSRPIDPAMAAGYITGAQTGRTQAGKIQTVEARATAHA